MVSSQRYFLRISLFVVLVLALVAMVHDSLLAIFRHNPTLNAVILGGFTFGLIWVFFQMIRLRKEEQWLSALEAGKIDSGTPQNLHLLKPLSLALNESSFSGTFSTITTRSILVSIEERLDITRDINRYLMGLLVFLGLLGTFWGLSQTIGSIANVIGGLNIGGEKVQDAFETMKMGLQSPLVGMGTAFSCSMFGLAGSLIIGFLDLQYGKALNSFYHSIEEKMALITRSGFGDASHSGPAYSQGLLEQTVEALSSLQGHMKQGEDNRSSMVKAINIFSDKLSQMAEQMTAHQVIMKKIAQNHIDLQENLMQLVKTNNQAEQTENLIRLLRSLEGTSTKMLEEMVEGRTRSTAELKNEIRLVARTLSALANGQEIAA
jgi:hypothetical protein